MIHQNSERIKRQKTYTYIINKAVKKILFYLSSFESDMKTNCIKVLYLKRPVNRDKNHHSTLLTEIKIYSLVNQTKISNSVESFLFLKCIA